MNEDLQSGPNAEPLRLLELFPVRKLSSCSMDQAKFQKIFEMLKCALCERVIANPTYIRCSHRFCKECIEKHIRLSELKSCPICKSETLTKRDSKLDQKMISFISLSFGDVDKFYEQVKKSRAEASAFIVTRGSLQKTNKRERVESENKSREEPTPRKRIKRLTSDEERERSQKRLEIIKSLDQSLPATLARNKSTPHPAQIATQPKAAHVQPLAESKPKLTSQTPALQFAEINNNTKGKAKKKKAQPIQIFSSQHSNEVYPEVNKTKDTENEATGVVLPTNSKKSQKNLKTNNIRIQSSQNRSFKRQASNNEAVQASSVSKNDGQLGASKRQKMYEKLVQQHFIDSRLLKTRQILLNNLKDHYLKALLIKTQKKPMLTIEVCPKPSSKLTPKLPSNDLKLSLDINVQQLRQFIFSRLNINKNVQKVGRLYVKHGSEVTELIDGSLVMLQLVENYWKDYRGMVVLDRAEDLPKHLRALDHANKSPCERVLYYEVDYTEMQNLYSLSLT